MAILQRQVNGRRKFKGVVYLHRPTKDKKELVYDGREYRKVYESLDTDEAYQRALAEKRKGKSVVWTGERIKVRGKPARTYGVFTRTRVKLHRRKRK